MQIFAIFINHTQPVRIAVRSNTQMIVVIHHEVCQLLQRILAGCRHSSSKKGIVLFVQHIYIAATG